MRDDYGRNRHLDNEERAPRIGASAIGGGATVTNCPTIINPITNNTTINLTLHINVTSVEDVKLGFLSRFFKKVIKNESTHHIQCGLGENQTLEQVLETVLQGGEVRRIEG